MNTRYYVGIDPGQSGGIACIHSVPGSIEEVAAKKMPETERDIYEVLRDVCGSMDTFCIIEKVHSMPKQGVVSTFKFGRNYGFLRGILIAQNVPFDEVSPGVWQRHLGCLTKGDKNITKSKAQQLFPTIKVTHSIADSLLIAEYCRRIKSGERK